MPAVRVLHARWVVFSVHAQCRLQSAKAGAQAFGKTAVPTGAELRSSGWFDAENPVLILVFVWCL